MLSTPKVTIRSAANAAGVVIIETIRAMVLERFFMGVPSTSNGQQQRGDVIEREGGCNEHRRDPECGPDEAAGDERCAGGTVGAGSPRLPVDEVEAVSEDASGCSDEQWFIRRERRQIADPGATDAEAEQDERHDAARRGRERAEYAAEGDQALPTALVTRRGHHVPCGRQDFCRSLSRCIHVGPCLPC